MYFLRPTFLEGILKNGYIWVFKVNVSDKNVDLTEIWFPFEILDWYFFDINFEYWKKCLLIKIN